MGLLTSDQESTPARGFEEVGQRATCKRNFTPNPTCRDVLEVSVIESSFIGTLALRFTAICPEES
jgi:hypothetical protein